MKIKIGVADRYKWHSWFAWYPVVVTIEECRVLVWLDHIERSRWAGQWIYRPLQIPPSEATAAQSISGPQLSNP